MNKQAAIRARAVVLRPAVTFLFLILGTLALFYLQQEGSAYSRNGDQAASAAEPEGAETQQKYSKFSHDVPQHKKECNSCHKFPSANWEKVRDESEAFPDITDYPKHDSCLSCHRRQFFSGPKPVICSICHKNPSPRDSSRHPFPNPRELFDESEKGRASFSGFAVYFPHEMHVAMLGERRPPGRRNGKESVFVRAGFRKGFQSETCAMCHQILKPQGETDDEYVTKPPQDLGDGFWLKKGTFMSAPRGHSQCFTCHSADAGLNPAPADCGTCHVLKPKDFASDFDPAAARRMDVTDKLLIASWRMRNSSATFRHEWFSHADMDCTVCHSVGEINTSDPKSKTVPVASCSGCHITATSDDGGILNYEIDARKKDAKFQCVKCHLAYGAAAIPDSHMKAVEDLGGN